MESRLKGFWDMPATSVLESLHTSAHGLTTPEAQRRLAAYGENRIGPAERSSSLRLLLVQFTSPIILILVLASMLSFLVHDRSDAAIILAIIGASGLLGFWQEARATDAVQKLLRLVQIKTTVLRDSQETQLLARSIVPGDIIVVSAGADIPADSLLLEAKDLHVNEAALTGESYPVEKTTGPVPHEAPMAQRGNVLFMGTSVTSGMAKAVVVHTGRETEFAQIAERLRARAPRTEFERGLRRFGYFLMELTLLLVIAIFAINAYFGRPILDAFLFSLALAVGLTPQLLPAVVSVNLAHGASQMAQAQVIVKRLSSIENFGSMNLLCSDKTGTLTQGTIRMEAAVDARGEPSPKARLYAYLNARFESGFANPIDEALRRSETPDITGYTKLDEVPYDFIRKRLSILVSTGAANIMISKGAVPSILQACSQAELRDGTMVPISDIRGRIINLAEEAGRRGLRTIAVSYRDLGNERSMTKQHETALTFLGLLTFSDPPKPDLPETIGELNRLGVSLKIITGDSRHVAAHLWGQLGLEEQTILTGDDLQRTSDDALVRKAERVGVFAEVEPNQKERIVLALRKAGNIVGFLGDGINDAPALHAADVSISVDQAVDVAKEAADIVLLEKDLRVLIEGVRAGRRTFANTMKYVFMATSANFGNMFSMAGASLFLPFLPMLPKQILLTNLLTDFPEMAIAGDSVDPELVERPHRWDIRFIKRFMLIFGLLSCVFDYITFGALLFVFRADAERLRTGWFVESVVSAALIVLVIRTRHPSFRSRPSSLLLWATLVSTLAAMMLPLTPIGMLFGFRPLPASFLALLGGIVVSYWAAAELAKRLFYDG